MTRSRPFRQQRSSTPGADQATCCLRSLFLHIGFIERSYVLNDAEQRERHARLNFAHRALPQQIGKVAGLVDPKDDEDFIPAVDADLLPGARRGRNA